MTRYPLIVLIGLAVACAIVPTWQFAIVLVALVALAAVVLVLDYLNTRDTRLDTEAQVNAAKVPDLQRRVERLETAGSMGARR